MPNYVIGLDIGQHVDHSALAIVERLLHGTVAAPFSGGNESNPDDDTYEDVYRIVHLRQWPLGTIPQTVIADLSDMIHLAQGRLAMACIAYDATGIGASWRELFRQRHFAGDLTSWQPRGYVISGEQVPGRGLNVRKIDLMSKIQVTGNDGRLELDPDLHLADRFAMQLTAITAKPTPAGRLSFGAPQAVHDDLVTAVSLALHSRTNVEPRVYGTQPAPALDPLTANPG